MKTKAFSFTHRTKAIAGGTVGKNDDVTSGELAESSGATGVSGPITESELASDALSLVGRLKQGTSNTHVKVTLERLHQGVSSVVAVVDLRVWGMNGEADTSA